MRDRALQRGTPCMSSMPLQVHWPLLLFRGNLPTHTQLDMAKNQTSHLTKLLWD